MPIYSTEDYLKYGSDKFRGTIVDELGNVVGSDRPAVDAEESTGRMVGRLAMLAELTGFKGLNYSLFPTEDELKIRRTGTHKDGYRVAELTDGSIVNLTRTGTHVDGYRVGELPDGRVLRVHGKDDDPGLGDFLSRTAGILLGFGAGLIQSPWAFGKSSMEAMQEAERQNLPFAQAVTAAIGGGLVGAVREGLRATFKEGEWGTTFPDFIKYATGKTPAEHLKERIKSGPLSEAEEGWAKDAMVGLGNVAAETVDLLLEASLEAGIYASPGMVRQTLRKMKYGTTKDFIRQAGPIPKLGLEDIPENRQFGIFVREAEKKQAKAIASGSLGRTMKDIDYLLENPKELDGIMKALMSRPSLIGMDETTRKLMEKIRAESVKRGELLTGLKRVGDYEYRPEFAMSPQMRMLDAINSLGMEKVVPRPVLNNYIAQKDAVEGLMKSDIEVAEFLPLMEKLFRHPTWRKAFSELKRRGVKVNLVDFRSPDAVAHWLYDPFLEKGILEFFLPNIRNHVTKPGGIYYTVLHEMQHGFRRLQIEDKFGETAKAIDDSLAQIRKYIMEPQWGVQESLNRWDNVALPHEIRANIGRWEFPINMNEWLSDTLENPILMGHLSSIPGSESRYFRGKLIPPGRTVWDELFDISAEISGLKGVGNSVLRDLKDVMETYHDLHRWPITVDDNFRFYSPTKVGEVHYDLDIGGGTAPGITLEATGLKQAFEMIGEGFLRVNKWVKRNWGERVVPEIDGSGSPFKQAEDVQKKVLEIL